jgi:hypothetical protein
LRLEAEDDFLQLLIELCDDYFEFLDHIEPIFLSPKGISLFTERLQLDHMTLRLWDKILSQLNQISKDEHRNRRLRFAVQSKILSEVAYVLKELRGRTWTLLYRGTRDGFAASSFHAKCDNHQKTITLILTTKGYIFGGFTPTAWDSTEVYKADNSVNSFLLSLKNARNTEPRKFTHSNASTAIRCYASYGPTFGDGNDIHISNGCDGNMNSYTFLGKGYVNDTGMDGKEVFTGESQFQVKEIKVFTLTD